MIITDAMEMWAAWQERYQVNLGHSGKSPVIASGGINCWDDLAESVDSWICGEIDAAMDDLVRIHPAQAAAVNHQYLHAVFRFPRGNLTELLGLALDWLFDDLTRRGVHVEAITQKTLAHNREMV